jgi:hypothetical protein
MKQNQLFLTLNDQNNRSREKIYRRNQPLAEWWFRHIRASLEDEEPPCAPWLGPEQKTFHWR